MSATLANDRWSYALALLAVLIGILAGLGAIAFRGLIALVHNLFFYGKISFLYHTNEHAAASPLGIGIILVPVVGAAIVVFLVRNFAPEAKGRGVTEVMDAMYYERGIIRPVVALIKALASAASIGSGGSAGREGPIIQIAAAFGSGIAQLVKLPPWQRMTLISCGAAGGIAATFNTPIGGLLFAAELIMPEISARTLVPVAIATGAATFVGRLVFGDHPSFYIPHLAATAPSVFSLTTLLLYLAFGCLVGLVSVLYIRMIYGVEDVADRTPGGYYVAHLAGMLLVGILIWLFLHFTGHYYIQGVGYAAVEDVLTSTLGNPWFLLLLFASKLTATALTLGSGASGGVFSPSIFIGATLGAAYALLVSRYVPGAHMDEISAAVVGMAGIVGSATGAVVASIVMIFEMTRDYDVIIPLIVTASVAYGVRRFFLEGSIYDIKLARRGHPIPGTLQTNLYLLNRAGEILRTPIVCVDPEREPDKLRLYLARHRRVPHVVVMRGDAVRGVLSADRVAGFDFRKTGLEQALGTFGESHYAVASADDMLFDVIARLRETGADIAVVTRTGELKNAGSIMGLLTWADLYHSSSLPRNLLQRHRKKLEVDID